MALRPVDGSRTLFGLAAFDGSATAVVFSCDGANRGLGHRLRRRPAPAPVHPVHRIHVFDALGGADGGSCEPDQIGAAVARCSTAGAVFVSLGGRRVPTPRIVQAMASQVRPTLLHLGARVDGGPGRGLRHAADPAAGAIQVGVRAALPSLDFDAPSRRDGHTLWAPDDVSDRGPDALAEAARNAIGHRPVFLSIDMDVIDPAFAPGVPDPVPGGLTPREMFRFVRNLVGLRFVGAALGGCSVDGTDPVTDALAEQVIYEILALIALRSTDET